MQEQNYLFEDYFAHLQKTSFLGRAYKKFYASPILYFLARRFGSKIIEIGSGAGNGILGAFSKRVYGLEINPLAVRYTKAKGFNVDLIDSDGVYPVPDKSFDVCVLDNVLEHLSEPHLTLSECHRITRENGGLIIVVPGLRGFKSDMDHKIFYDSKALVNLDQRWELVKLFSMPFFLKSLKLSLSMRQYCLVAVYKRVE
jgi:SAM-dependent methyltransferase